jgi:hypothetical protein
MTSAVFENPDGTLYRATLVSVPRKSKKEYRIVSLVEHPATPFKNIVILTKQKLKRSNANGVAIARKHLPPYISMPPDVCISTSHTVSHSNNVTQTLGADHTQHHLHVFDSNILVIYD